MKKLSLLIVFLFVLLSVSSAWATDMVLTNGFWSSSYSGCSGDILTMPVSSDLETLDPSCTDLVGLIVPFGSNIYTCDNPENTASSQIRSEANFSGGSGGRGFRQYIGTSGDPGADYTAYQSLEFPSGVTDVWIRYYERRSATTSGSRYGDTKDIYFHGTNCGVMSMHAFQYADGYRLVDTCGQSLDISVTSGAGLQTLLGRDEFDGNWHCVEVHITSHASTIDFLFWLEGILMDRQMTAPLNLGELITADLWQSKKGNTGQCETIDHDDIVVATPSYTGFVKDAHGNDMIGPIGWGGGDTADPTVTITAPTVAMTYDNGDMAQVTLSGTADDDLGVIQIDWSNQATGDAGTIAGSDSWTIADIPLNPGDNPISVTALDASGKSGQDQITVTRTVDGATDNIDDSGSGGGCFMSIVH